MEVVAKKGNLTRKFSEYSWNLLGNNKQGWVQVSDQTVTNTIQKPSTGEKPAPTTVHVENQIAKFESLIKSASVKFQDKDFQGSLDDAKEALKLNPQSETAQTAINHAMNGLTQKEESKPSTGEKSEEPGSDKKEKFLDLLSELNKTAIKDYFDQVDVKYESKANLDQLKNQLAEHLEYDEKKLKKILS